MKLIWLPCLLDTTYEYVNDHIDSNQNCVGNSGIVNYATCGQHNANLFVNNGLKYSEHTYYWTKFAYFAFEIIALTLTLKDIQRCWNIIPFDAQTILHSASIHFLCMNC